MRDRSTVPLDYARPGGRTIELALLKVPAAEPEQRLGSLVVNPGGPGAPGTDYAAQAGLAFRDPLPDHFDIVGFDPRGTGDSGPVDCLSDGDLDDYVAADPAPDTAAERADYVREMRATSVPRLRRELRRPRRPRHAPSRPPATWTCSAPRSASRRSTTSARPTAPSSARRTPSCSPTRSAGSSSTARSTRPSTRARARPAAGGAASRPRCARTSRTASTTVDSCFLGDTRRRGARHDRRRSSTDVDDEPLPTCDDRELTVGNAFYGVVAPLYNRDYWILLSQALQAGFDGDGVDAAAARRPLRLPQPDGATPTTCIEALHAINCLDDPYAIPPAQVPAAAPGLRGGLADVRRRLRLGRCSAARGFQVRSRASRRRRSTPTGRAPDRRRRHDPRPGHAASVGRGASPTSSTSGVLVSRDGDGHTGYNAGNDCVDEAVEGYLVDGTVPEDGLSC